MVGWAIVPVEVAPAIVQVAAGVVRRRAISGIFLACRRRVAAAALESEAIVQVREGAAVKGLAAVEVCLDPGEGIDHRSYRRIGPAQAVAAFNVPAPAVTDPALVEAVFSDPAVIERAAVAGTASEAAMALGDAMGLAAATASAVAVASAIAAESETVVVVAPIVRRAAIEVAGTTIAATARTACATFRAITSISTASRLGRAAGGAADMAATGTALRMAGLRPMRGTAGVAAGGGAAGRRASGGASGLRRRR